jgi:PKD repeat protein
VFAGANVPVKAEFTILPINPEAGQPILFIDQSAGEPVSWTWRFGDGTLSHKRNPVHTYKEPGFYEVSLVIRGPYGRISRVKHTVVVSPPYVCDFDWSPATPTETLPIQFFDRSTGVEICRWWWDFGDGEYSNEQNPVHTYSKAGTYSVTLTIWNIDGVSKSTSVVI